MVGGIEPIDQEQEGTGSHQDKREIYFVLEGASLEVAKVGKNYELLNCDDHINFLKRHGKDPAHYRPDIAHQVRTKTAKAVPLGLACDNVVHRVDATRIQLSLGYCHEWYYCVLDVLCGGSVHLG